MPKKARLTPEERNLIRRYLVWCYKTTKEELDKIDRYFTQLKADAFLLKRLKAGKDYRGSVSVQSYKDRVDGFEVYMEKKEVHVLRKKFADGEHKRLDPDYQYLKNRFLALEEAIRYFLGDGELKKITSLYEREMTGRILAAREHT